MAIEVALEEGPAHFRVSSVPMAHLSIELGHLYRDDFEGGPDRIATMAREVAPWAQAAQEKCARQLASGRARVSTCFLIDDYFTPFGTPQTLIPMIVDAYRQAGIVLDYIAREAACAQSGDVPIAMMVLDHLVPDPPPETDGSRPHVHESGWLANGLRSPTPDVMAMESYEWRPPREHAANRHSVFIDVQLWEETPAGRIWSCPFLAAVWQLLRLGAVRYSGRNVVEPVPWSTALPDTWDDFPAVVQVSSRADSFAAYRTFSALETRFLPVEHAVRAILSQIAIEHDVAGQIADRSRREGLTQPTKVVDRVSYAFI